MWSAMGHTNDDLKLAAQMKSAETSGALCDNKIDALFWLVGHPNGLSKEATTTCDAVMVEVSGPAIDKLVADNSYYFKATIPGGMYRGSPNDTPVFGVGATFVSSSATPENTVYQVVKAVFDNIDSFRKLHPAFANLVESDMVNNGRSAPLHAVRPSTSRNAAGRSRVACLPGGQAQGEWEAKDKGGEARRKLLHPAP